MELTVSIGFVDPYNTDPATATEYYYEIVMFTCGPGDYNGGYRGWVSRHDLMWRFAWFDVDSLGVVRTA